MSIITEKLICVFLLLALAGCASGQANTNTGPYGYGTTPAPKDLAAFYSIPADGRGLPPGQGSYADGQKVYMEKCVSCHGDKLQGVAGAGEPIIGGRGTLASGKPLKTVESYWPYATTVFDYVKRAMPFNSPGSLTNNETYSVTAYILAEAKIINKDTVINAKSLPEVQMPNEHGFIPDPRPDAP
ncbi:MAG TPA: cytochrome c [Burkholderiales bacterium]|nr:cytochrome c [Burkholderiales bacterium]